LVNKHKPSIAIFGGTFDPPHLGHQQIVQNAIANLDIDKLLVVPAYLNPFKSSSLATATKRLEWCHTLFDDLKKVEVNAYETKEGKSTFTSQTVKHFNIEYNVKYLIIGSDNLSTLTKWHDFDWLNANLTWVIVTRDGYELDVQMLREWKVLTLDAPFSSTQIRELEDLHYVDKQIQQSVQNVLQGQHK
jgi:nicotinate-nucleotide adenylyltransferase